MSGSGCCDRLTLILVIVEEGQRRIADVIVALLFGGIGGVKFVFNLWWCSPWYWPVDETKEM